MLGNGPKYIFQPSYEKIYKKILNSGGAIISEYPEDTPPISEKFRKRNRIVSGLSLGILVVEAEFRSGTSITARYAKEQGREVFAIPSDRENTKGMGTNILIKKGAKLVLDPSEIVETYTKKKISQITIEEIEARIKPKVNIKSMPKQFRKIYKILHEELSVNEISKETKIDISEIYEVLFTMEMEGLIESNQNKYKIKQ